MKIKSGYKVRSVAGQNIVINYGKLNVSMTKVIALNDTSLFLWNKLVDREFVLSDVVEVLLSEYEINITTAEADAVKWVAQMNEATLLEEV